jgi:hypothetical protein
VTAPAMSMRTAKCEGCGCDWETPVSDRCRGQPNPDDGDHARGELNFTARLNTAFVIALREAHDAGRGVPVNLLAAMLEPDDLSPSIVRLACVGQTWRHVGGPVRRPKPKRVVELGPWKCPIDGFEIESQVLRDGRVVEVCHGCERRRGGLCMDCGAKIRDGRAWRCPMHRRIHQNESLRAYTSRNREEINRKQRHLSAYKNLTPAQIEHDREIRRAWKARNPRKVLAWRRRQRLLGRGGYSTREQYLAYHARYRA